MTIQLSGIPKPFFNESLASWIQRVCQVYDLTLDRFHETFSTSGGLDPDLCLTSEQLLNVAKICGLRIEHFRIIQDCFCKLVERQALQRLLLTTSKDKYLYRFCPQCWSEDKIPYFRVEWRFRHGKYCLKHQSELRSECPCCGKVLAMHRALLGGTYKPPPVPDLATCLYCRANLRSNAIEADQFTDCSAEVVNNIAFQRAVISAMLHDYFFIQPFTEKWSLDQMLILIEGVGLETPDDRATSILAHFGPDDLSTLRGIVLRSLQGFKWLMPGHSRRQKLARSIFPLWITKIFPSTDD